LVHGQPVPCRSGVRKHFGKKCPYLFVRQHNTHPLTAFLGWPSTRWRTRSQVSSNARTVRASARVGFRCSTVSSANTTACTSALSRGVITTPSSSSIYNLLQSLFNHAHHVGGRNHVGSGHPQPASAAAHLHQP